jgi:hypothetical protein
LFLSEFNIEQFNKYVEQYLPQKIQERTSSYRTVAKFEIYQETSAAGIFNNEKSWHANLYKKSLKWSIFAFLFMLYFKRKQIQAIYPRLIFGLSFVLLFMGVANILSNLPSGDRYLTIVLLLALPLIIFYMQNSVYDLWTKLIAALTTPFLLFFFIVSVREGFYFISITTILGNPLLATFTMGQNIPLELLIK